MMKPLLIGQAPGPNTNPDLPLFPVPKTSAGGRLQVMTGLTRGQYLDHFERINLLPYFPGKVKRDDKFPMPPARLAATAIKPLLAGRTVILVGRNVAEAFEFPAEFHDWVRWPVRRPCIVTKSTGLAAMAVIPHPSGRNHWYNKAENRARSAAFWADFLNPAEGDKKVLPFVAKGSM